MVKSLHLNIFLVFLKIGVFSKVLTFFLDFEKKDCFQELKISWFHHKKGYFFPNTFLKRGHILHARTHMCTPFSYESLHRAMNILLIDLKYSSVEWASPHWFSNAARNIIVWGSATVDCLQMDDPKCVNPTCNSAALDRLPWNMIRSYWIHQFFLVFVGIFHFILNWPGFCGYSEYKGINMSSSFR